MVNEALKELRATGLGEGKHRTLRGEGVPRTFTQTNDLIAGALLEFVAGQTVGETLIDAYCGFGFFGHAMGERLRSVIGIDWNEQAIKTARASARSNERYICGDVAGTIESLLVNDPPDTVILDPSADGIDDRVTDALVINPPKRLIYVSCNPATLARDLARLRNKFKIGGVQPFDMFPQTAEIEAVAVLDLIGSDYGIRPESDTASINGNPMTLETAHRFWRVLFRPSGQSRANRGCTLPTAISWWRRYPCANRCLGRLGHDRGCRSGF